MTAGEIRADRADRSRIRAEMSHAFGTTIAYSANLYHRSDGWYYQKNGEEPDHLGATVAQVVTELRQIAIAQRDADRYDNWH